MKYISKFTGPQIDEKLENAAMRPELSGEEIPIDFQNGISKYTNDTLNSYHKNLDGEVTVNFGLKSQNEFNSTHLFTLPVGFRPSLGISLLCGAVNKEDGKITNIGYASAIILPNGNVITDVKSGKLNSIFGSISFKSGGR